jgi:hypothetical protein
MWENQESDGVINSNFNGDKTDQWADTLAQMLFNNIFSTA